MTSTDLPWYVLYTKPRNEKKVAQRLSEAGYTVYCPLQKVRRQWSDRSKVVEEPLFKSYLFIQIEDHRRDEVFSFPGTVRYLFWLRRPAQVRQIEINTIQKWLGEYNHEDIDISHIQTGALVRIDSGPFTGEAAVLMDKSNKKAVVQLKELGLQLSLSLSNSDLSVI
jgi:transcription antitermination factor NusG